MVLAEGVASGIFNLSRAMALKGESNLVDRRDAELRLQREWKTQCPDEVC
jgi:hypothetical protein